MPLCALRITHSTSVINQLADLFFNLEYCEAAAVTPTIDLAKLALVTSRDEEEEEADKGGTDSSNDTDATLVDDLASRSILNESLVDAPPQSRSPNSILGKRSRELEGEPSAMDLDPSPPNPDFTPSSHSRQGSDSPPPLMSPGSPFRIAEASGSGSSSSNVDNDVSSKKAPPLPPRKSTAAASDSVMMFGMGCSLRLFLL